PPEPSGRGEPQLEAPAELPVMLQGLLHPSCRLQALHLLASFVDLGVWAAQLALLVGSRPYLTRLLSHDEGDGKLEVAGLALVVWTKILVADGGKEGLSGKDAFHSFFKLAWHAEPLSRLGMEVRRDSSSSRLVVGGVDRDPMQRTPVSQWNTAEQRQASRGEGEHHQNLAIRPGDRLKSVNSSINTATLIYRNRFACHAHDYWEMDARLMENPVWAFNCLPVLLNGEESAEDSLSWKGEGDTSYWRTVQEQLLALDAQATTTTATSEVWRRGLRVARDVVREWGDLATRRMRILELALVVWDGPDGNWKVASCAANNASCHITTQAYEDLGDMGQAVASQSVPSWPRNKWRDELGGFCVPGYLVSLYFLVLAGEAAAKYQYLSQLCEALSAMGMHLALFYA
ncbi:unnamed protein product, partial [Polarella glacialis]